MARPLSNWLALREAADTAARSARLARRIASEIDGHAPLRIVDLGAGTGANVRYLANRLPRPQHWLLVDRDRTLLEEARGRTHAADLVETRDVDLGVLDGLDIFAGRHLVTASALLDLVSETWLRSLAAHTCAAGAAALFALTYDGRSSCLPAEPEDEIVRTLFNQHQTRSDKGFGVAAGPDATECAARAFTTAGYQVVVEKSDWILEPSSRDLQRELIEGWAAAAREIAPEQAATIFSWTSRRIAHVDVGRSRITVGHRDLMAWGRSRDS
jgi:SAM-dependent methyltransferase